MQPITFECSQLIPYSALEICAAIADVTLWSEFKGYGPLPGIARAEYVRRTDDMVGSQVRVHNTDGSEHVEEITVWEPGRRVTMKLHGFTPPLRRLATHFTEEWGFTVQDDGTLVTRKFQMFATQPLARPFLWLISLLFRQAVRQHLSDMARAS
ncbi:MAG: hypothetical protein Fur0021_10020 [Candidatus Promineifilaceae bacterium]